MPLLLALATACPVPVDDTADTPAADGWSVVADGLDHALLSVAGTAWDDVWVVGAGGTVLRWDGATWTAHGDQGDRWWVSVAGEAVWTAGAGGVVSRLDTDETFTLDPAVTLFGVWGPSPDEVWAVGGDPYASADAARMFRYADGAWAEVDLPAAAAAQPALYKVWGTGPDDVWAVGTAGTVLHGGRSGWTAVDSGATGTLLTTHGGYAVGGTGNGAILAWDGAAWVDESPDYALPLAGVHAGAAVYAVGQQGSVWRRGTAGWEPDPRGQPTYRDFHAVWQDPDGGVWAAGGNLGALVDGVLVYAGDRAVGAVP